MSLLLFIVGLFALPATAQSMFKCVNPAGGIEYRGSPCEGSTRNTPMVGGSYSNVDGMSQHEIQRTLRPRLEPTQQYQQGQQSTGEKMPSQQDIKNMETSASSITLSKRDKMIRQAEIEAAKDRRAGGGGEVDYSAVNAEDQRTAARRQAAVAQSTAQAQAQMQQANRNFTQDTIRNCTSGNCRGASGANYTPAPEGGFRRREDGAKCNTLNGRLDCF